MGGVAGTPGPRALTAPRWLVGGEAALAVAPDAPTLWLVDIGDPAVRRRAEAVEPLPGESEAVARHRDAGERLLRRRLARLLLAAAAEGSADTVAIGRNAAGAPVVEAPAGWHLSLAARWPACLIGVARQPLGVDVEAVGEPLPPDLLTAAEERLVGGLGDAGRRRAGARRWALKEAHAKWTGRPRALDPRTVETAAPGLVVSPLGRTRCWWRDEPGHVAALCTA